MQHRYEVLFHTGDAWGQGCASSVWFRLVGSQANLESSQCVQKEVFYGQNLAARRARAVQYAAAKKGPDEPKRRRGMSGANGAAAAATGDLPQSSAGRRNVFSLFSRWLLESGGVAQLPQLLTSSDTSGDGTLSREELRGLLTQAVPSVSELETQLFLAMVDVNDDGAVSGSELSAAVADCEAIDGLVATGGSAASPPTAPEAPTEAPGGPVTSGGGGGAGGTILALEGLVGHLRSNAAAVDAKLLQMSPAGGYLTYNQLNELLQEVLPDTMGGRGALRALMAHVARTANITPHDPGVHVSEFKRCFGLPAAAPLGPPEPAAVAAGWVPGRPRDIFKLLRYHAKHNRTQLDELFPRGSELTANQLRHLVRQVLESRRGEPPLSGREGRLLVAALDANGNGQLSRDEFDGGLRECRDLSAVMTQLRGRGNGDMAAALTAMDPAAPLLPSEAAAAVSAGKGEGRADMDAAVEAVGEAGGPLTWSAFSACLQGLAEVLEGRGEEVAAAWGRHDSRGKGRLDACELRQVLLEVSPQLRAATTGPTAPPSQLQPAHLRLLRAVLLFLDAWDPSEHGLLSRKHTAVALRGQSPPASLQPLPPPVLVAAGDGTAGPVGAPSPMMQRLARRLTAAAAPLMTAAGADPLPDPRLWAQWHGNIKTPERPSGTVCLGGATPPPSPAFWRMQWRWHSSWMARTAAYRRALAATAGAGSEVGPTLPPSSSPALAAGQATEGVVSASAVPPPAGETANSIESRMWPHVTVTSVPYLCAVHNQEAPRWVNLGLKSRPSDAPPSPPQTSPPPPPPSQPPASPAAPPQPLSAAAPAVSQTGEITSSLSAHAVAEGLLDSGDGEGKVQQGGRGAPDPTLLSRMGPLTPLPPRPAAPALAPIASLPPPNIASTSGLTAPLPPPSQPPPSPSPPPSPPPTTLTPPPADAAAGPAPSLPMPASAADTAAATLPPTDSNSKHSADFPQVRTTAPVEQPPVPLQPPDPDMFDAEQKRPQEQPQSQQLGPPLSPSPAGVLHGELAQAAQPGATASASAAGAPVVVEPSPGSRTQVAAAGAKEEEDGDDPQQLVEQAVRNPGNTADTVGIAVPQMTWPVPAASTAAPAVTASATVTVEATVEPQEVEEEVVQDVEEEGGNDVNAQQAVARAAAGAPLALPAAGPHAASGGPQLQPTAVPAEFASAAAPPLSVVGAGADAEYNAGAGAAKAAGVGDATKAEEGPGKDLDVAEEAEIGAGAGTDAGLEGCGSSGGAPEVQQKVPSVGGVAAGGGVGESAAVEGEVHGGEVGAGQPQPGTPRAEDARPASRRKPGGEPPPELKYPLKAPPPLVPGRVLLYEVVLAPGTQLGNVETVAVRAPANEQEGPCYLEAVEVRCPSSSPALCWRLTVRRWLTPGEAVSELRPDSRVWEEWDMQVDPVSGSPTAVLYVNPNLQEAVWRAPPPAPLPSFPGAVPYLPTPTDLNPSSSNPSAPPAVGTPHGPLAAAAVPLATPRPHLRFLDSFRTAPVFRPTRIRQHYGLGFGGLLGLADGMEVRIRGQPCTHSLAVHTRGGYKWVDPDDPAVTRLLPVGGAAAVPALYGMGAAATAVSSAAAASALSGGLFPGVREAVVLSYDLVAAGRNAGTAGGGGGGEAIERYGWLLAHVALDDSAGAPPAPVRFSVLTDGMLAWSHAVAVAGQLATCCVPLQDCRQLELVVESDFSGGGRAVWLSPGLLPLPLRDTGLLADLKRQAEDDNELSHLGARDVKVCLRQESGGDVTYMAPVSAVPPEVARTSSTASYRVVLYTATGRGAGTRGKVYVRLQGRRGGEGGAAGAGGSGVLKSALFCVNADGTPLKEGDKYCARELLTAPLMDEVESVVLQHVPGPSAGGLLLRGGGDGGRKSDWAVQHAEVSCVDTGRIWYFVAGGWFRDLAAGQMEGAGGGGGGGGGGTRVATADMELTLPRVVSETAFKVVFHILSSGKGVGMGVEGELQMVLLGAAENGYATAPFSLPGNSIDRAHETRLLVSPVPLGQLQTLELSCGQRGLLATRLQCVEVIRMADGRHFLFLAPAPDPADPPDLAATRVLLRAAAQPYFRISTFTSDLPEASTDARVYIDLFGSRGRLMDLYLRDATGDCFNEGCEDVFFFPDPGLGDLSSVCISHDDSGSSPNWHLDRVEICHTASGGTVVFPCSKWIGLGVGLSSLQDDDSEPHGRFGADRVLERVLYPASSLALQQGGRPLKRYHLVFQLQSALGQLWHAVEAVQLVGTSGPAGALEYSDIVILDGRNAILDQELDNQYVRHIQAATATARAAVQAAGNETADAGTEEQQVAQEQEQISATPSQKQVVLQVVLRKAALHRPRANISLGSEARRLVITLHGCSASSKPLLLDAASSTAMGVAPFTTLQDDVFQVTSDVALGPQLLRADLQLSVATAATDWGVLLQSVTVRDTSDPSSVPVDFAPGAVGAGGGGVADTSCPGHWLGVSPETQDPLAAGAQELRLLPVGTCAVSVTARAFHDLAALHVRHDNPRLWPGWDIRTIHVLPAAPPPQLQPQSRSQPTLAQLLTAPRAAATADVGSRGVGEGIEAPSADTQGPLPPGPQLFEFSGDHPAPVAWPSQETPFIRHFLAPRYAAQPYPPEMYFKVPVIESALTTPPNKPSQQHMATEISHQQQQQQQQLADVDSRATAALAHLPDPEQLKAYREAYDAELAAYQALTEAGRGSEADVFSLLRARLKAEQELLSGVFVRLDSDKDDKLTPEQVHALLPEVLPPQLPWSPAELSYLGTMMTLGSPEPLTQPQIMSALKSCRSAYKEAASMARMAADANEGGAEGSPALATGIISEMDGLGAELVLCTLSEQLVAPRGTAAAAEAFRSYDKDGSGYLEIGELCGALRALPAPQLSSWDTRLLLAYLFQFGDKDQDMRLSIIELQSSLAPFIRRPTEEQLRKAYQAYGVTHNLPALMWSLHELQPALLPAAAARAVVAASGDTPGGDGSSLAMGPDPGAVALSALPVVVAAVLPDVNVPPHEVSQLQQLLDLDRNERVVAAELLSGELRAAAEAIKRADAIARMVSAAQSDGERVVFEPNLGSAEGVLSGLAELLGEEGQGEEGQAAGARAFEALDQDGSGQLEAAELCAAMRQVLPEISTEELRTLLAYIQRTADKDSNGRISLLELQALLQPFR